MAKKEVKKEKVKSDEVIEEILEEIPEAKVVGGEETSEVVEVGGALYRLVREGSETHYVPL